MTSCMTGRPFGVFGIWCGNIINGQLLVKVGLFTSACSQCGDSFHHQNFPMIGLKQA